MPMQLAAAVVDVEQLLATGLLVAVQVEDQVKMLVLDLQ
jgi:hypothetical protein